MSLEELRCRSAQRECRQYHKNIRLILIMEAVMIALEGMYQIGGTIVRGYPSFGGESAVLVALLLYLAYRYRTKKGESRGTEVR